VNLGATVDDAMQNLGKRLKSEDLDIVISSYLVQKEVGGNLNEIMEKVAETIRERLRIQGDVRVLTAQGKLSGAIVGFLPFVVFFWLMLTNPQYFAAMLGEPYWGIVPGWVPLMAGTQIPWGVLLAILALGLQAFGIYLIYRIVSIKV
jgi:tight adherence protein B